jgi:TetR/AcrR family fatty acid metabolism transcriptional regulator
MFQNQPWPFEESRMGTKEDKQKAILEAATQVFAEYGYHDAKMAKIAEVAGVGAGSLYLYFKNKEGILINIFLNLWDDMTRRLTALAQRTDLDAEAKLDGLIDLVFDIFARNGPLASVFVHEQRLSSIKQEAFWPYFEKIIAIAESLIVQGQEDGLFEAHINPKIYCHYVFGGVHQLIDTWAQHPNQFPLDTIRRELQRFCKRAILTRPTPSA